MLFKKKEDLPKKYRPKKISIVEIPFNNRFQKWTKGFFDVTSPVCIEDKNGKIVDIVLGKYPLMDEKAALRVLKNAKTAYQDGRGLWPTLPESDRINYVNKFLEKFVALREEIIPILMWEIAKNEEAAANEFDRTVVYIEETINELKNRITYSNSFIHENNFIGKIKRSPLGVVLCMGPYNYPLNESFTTIIPALIMGNTVIFKPPKKGVLLHKKIIEAFVSTFPKGVFNVVYGEGEVIVRPIMETGDISVLAFIGSSKVANIIQRYHPKPNRLNLVMGLEAKNVGIVMDDCDLELAVKACVKGSLSYNGQRCTALKILYVQEKIVNKFNKKFVDAVDKMKMGLPFDNTPLTPVPQENVDYYNQLVKDAVSKGAKNLSKNKKDYHTIFNPKVLYPVNSKMDIYHREQFGPIVPIVKFKDYREPIEYVIKSDYGQQASIFSNNSRKIGNIVDHLINQVSRININTQCQRGPDTFPFGGRKDSAVQMLSVSDALKVFSIKTLVAANLSDDNKDIFKKIVNKNQSAFLKNDIIL